jgi:hypothetical protein
LQNLLLTPTQIAVRLGIEGRADIVADLLRRGLLPIAGQDEEGVPLVRQHHVEQRGPGLLARDFSALRSPRLRRLAVADLPPLLPCGCAIDQRDEPTFLCRTGQSLEIAMGLARAFAAAAPHDLFFQRLAAITEEALARHLAGPPPLGEVAIASLTGPAEAPELRRAIDNGPSAEAHATG